MLSQVQPSLGPSSKVIGQGDGAAAGSLVDAVRDVLLECRCAGDGRLVGLLVFPDLVRRTVRLELAQLLALGGPLAVRGVLLDIILDQGVTGPAVNGD